VIYLLSIFIFTLAVLPIYRLVKGPTVWDRIAGFVSLTTKFAIFLSVLGFAEHMDYMVYVALVIVLLSLGSMAVLSHFLEE
jgi:multisubunit Na+/H+ antiporter MnhF subunit